MLRRNVIFGFATLALLAFAQVSQASYVLTAGPVTTTPSPATLGGTTFTFSPTAGGTQMGSTISNFNVDDVGVTSTTTPPAADTGTITISQTLTLVGSGTTPGTETFTLSGTLTLISGNSGGVASVFSGTVTPVSGSGFSVSFAGYAPPSPGSNGTGGTTGNISILVVPTATVPEPASIAMLGLGLVGAGGVALRRRMAK